MNKKIILIVGIVVLVGIGFLLGTKDTDPEIKSDISNIDQEALPNGEVSASMEGEGAGKKAGFTMSDLLTHNTPTDCYAAVNGLVYNLTAWIEKHPGGEENILKLCGTDGTAAFTKKHGMNDKAKNTLAGFEIGVLQ